MKKISYYGMWLTSGQLGPKSGPGLRSIAAPVPGKVADERYEKMSVKFKAEQAEFVETVDTLETEISEEESQAVNVDRFLSVVRRYTTIEELTPAIVHEFIDRIIVHEPEQARGDRRQKVEIIYNNIGAVDRLALKAFRA